MGRDDRVWIYSAGAHQFICAVGRVVQIEQHTDGSWHAILVWDVEATRMLERQPIPRSTFGQSPQHPQRANTATTKVLDRWLEAQNLQQSRMEEPPTSEEDARLRVLADIVRRQGQRQFRASSTDNYGRRCCATGETTEEVLEAAHISPYLGIKSNRATNGLLLCADVHTLFDLHLLSIDGRGRWAVSLLLDGSAYAALRGLSLAHPKRIRRIRK